MARIVREMRTEAGQIVRVVHGDLTEEAVDAIVNAANSQLAHGGGVAGAIVRRGGPEIQRESDALAPVSVGGAVITGAGRLPARFVIHAVGPRWGEGAEDDKLQSAVQSALELAHARGLTSLSLPAIATGVFGFPKARAARLIVDTLLGFLAAHPDSPVRLVHVCNFDQPTVDVFAAEFDARSPRGPGG